MGKRSHSNDYRQSKKQKNDKKQQRIQNNKIKFITSQYKKSKTPEKKKKKISEKIYQQKKYYKNQKHKYNYKEKQIKYNKYHKINKEIQRNQQINNKSKKEKQKQKQKQIKKEKDKNQRQKQKQKSKSPSPSVQIQNNQQINEKARARKLAMRKVKARLLKLNDILNSDDSDDDSDRSKDKNKNQKNIQPPVPQIITPIKPKIGKRVSKWNVISANQPILPRIQEQVINRQPEIKEKNLSLEIQASEDLLKLSEDKSIEVEDPNINTEIMNENQQKQIDPLDEYLLQMEGNKVDHMIVQAVKQVQLPKRGDNVITFEDIMAQATVEPQQSLQQQKNLIMENDDKFQIQFMEAIKNWQQKKQIDDDKGIMMQNNQDKQSDISNFQQQPQTQLDFFAKQRKMAQRKQLNQIDHSIIKYQEVKFNLYRQAQQVKNQNIKQIIKYRKQAGDIKIRGKNIINPIINWFQCGFNDRILNVIQKRNYHKPFPIQEQSLPLIMSGRDMIGIAETGSGKTLAYLLPVLKHITNQRIVQQGQGPISIIMTPTRELARQVYLEAKHFCKCMNVRVIAVYGGLSIQTQLSELRRGAELVICTPGRMIDILTLNKGKITNLRRVTLVVLDEADRMFDLGFEPQITRIIDNIRPKRQVVMFSATFPKNVQNLARRTLNDPVEVIVGGRGQACRNVEQIVEVREDNTKFLRLLQILGLWNEQGSILIFIDKQTEADYLFHELLKYGYHSLVLHGAMDPDDREFTIYDFKKRIKNILIATSICARGLDIKSIILVVNFKCPNHLEDYIHRIGRTGRAGNKGTAITFITSTQQQYSIDLIKALEMAEVRPPEQLIKLSQSYLSKVKKGQARKIRNRNIQGSGFKFDQEEEEKTNQIKDMLKKQLKSEGIGAFEDSDEDDIEMKKKKEEDIRGRNQQDRIAQAIKNPQIKNKLLNQAVKAVSDAIKNGSAMTTQKLLDIAVGSMKESVTKHKVVRTVDDGVEQVTKLINQFQNKIGGQNSQHFSYDYEINDYPLGARQKACNQSFLHGIQNQTNCTISLRGVYVEPTKKAPVGCRKLYLHIQGANKYYVNTAYKEIKIVLEQSAYQNMHMGVIPGKYAICN